MFGQTYEELNIPLQRTANNQKDIYFLVQNIQRRPVVFDIELIFSCYWYSFLLFKPWLGEIQGLIGTFLGVPDIIKTSLPFPICLRCTSFWLLPSTLILLSPGTSRFSWKKCLFRWPKGNVTLTLSIQKRWLHKYDLTVWQYLSNDALNWRK